MPDIYLSKSNLMNFLQEAEECLSPGHPGRSLCEPLMGGQDVVASQSRVRDALGVTRRNLQRAGVDSDREQVAIEDYKTLLKIIINFLNNSNRKNPYAGNDIFKKQFTMRELLVIVGLNGLSEIDKTSSPNPRFGQMFFSNLKRRVFGQKHSGVKLGP